MSEDRDQKPSADQPQDKPPRKEPTYPWNPAGELGVRSRRRSVLGLLAELLSAHRPMELRHWTPEDVLSEVAHDIEATRQRPA